MKSIVLAAVALLSLAGVASACGPAVGQSHFGYSQVATHGYNHGQQYYGQQYQQSYHQSYDVQFLIGVPLAIVNPYTPTLAVSPQAVYVQPAPLVVQPQPVAGPPAQSLTAEELSAIRDSLRQRFQPLPAPPAAQPQVLPKVQRQNLTSDDGLAEVTTASYRPRQTVIFADTAAVDPGCNYVPRQTQNIVIASDNFGYAPRQNLRFNDRALAYVPRQRLGDGHGRGHGQQVGGLSLRFR